MAPSGWDLICKVHPVWIQTWRPNQSYGLETYAWCWDSATQLKPGMVSVAVSFASTNNITSHCCSFSSTMFCKKNKQTTSQVIEFLFRFCSFEAWSFARQKNKTKTSRSQLDFLESHCSLVSDAQCDLDWAELDNCVPFPDQYLESEHGPRHREAEDRLDSSKLIHGFL